MGRIGQAAMGESVRHQKIAEFVMNRRHWNRQQRQDGKTDGNDDEKEQRDDKRFAPRQFSKDSFKSSQDLFALSRSKSCEQEKSKGDCERCEDGVWEWELQHQAALEEIILWKVPGFRTWRTVMSVTA
jgi:hypothetical protein